MAASLMGLLLGIPFVTAQESSVTAPPDFAPIQETPSEETNNSSSIDDPAGGPELIPDTTPNAPALRPLPGPRLIPQAPEATTKPRATLIWEADKVPEGSGTEPLSRNQPPAPLKRPVNAEILPESGGVRLSPPVMQSEPPGFRLYGGTEEEQPFRATPPGRYVGPGDEEVLQDQQIQLEPPGKERVFQRNSEESFRKILEQEGRGRTTPERIEFPKEPVLTKDPYAERRFAPTTEVVEPNYVCHRRLYFEDLNSERYGWDLGFIQPFVSTGLFFADVVTLPYHVGTDPLRKYECSAGYCLPGDPVPYMLYPPQLSLTGAALEAGTAVALFAIFPG